MNSCAMAVPFHRCYFQGLDGKAIISSGLAGEARRCHGCEYNCAHDFVHAAQNATKLASDNGAALMFTAETTDEIENVAQEFGIEPAALLAIAEVESGGSVFAMIDGRAGAADPLRGALFRPRGLQATRGRGAGRRAWRRPTPARSPTRPRRRRAGGCSHAPPRSTARRPTNPCHGGSAR